MILQWQNNIFQMAQLNQMEIIWAFSYNGPCLCLIRVAYLSARQIFPQNLFEIKFVLLQQLFNLQKRLVENVVYYFQ